MAYNKDTNWENEKKYLDNLSKNGDAAQKAWAEQQKKVLASAQEQYGGSSGGSGSGATSNSGSNVLFTTPTSSYSGGGSSSNVTSSGGNSQYTGYTIGSDKGKEIAQNMGIGQTYTASDGSVWTKNNDGTVSVNHKGVVTDNAYQPTDYGILGQHQMEAGLGWRDVLKTYNARQKKALTTEGLEQYANDDLQQAMWDYILQGQQAENKQNTVNGYTDWNNNHVSDNPKPTTTSKYDPQIEQLLNEILNRDDFSYDAKNDPLYQQYAAMYQREGDRAMRDTMAEAAASAGGMNTYAITAAQQAANYYNSQLNDKIPELYQLAYSMYLDDKASKVEDLGILQKLDETQYNRYRDTIKDWKDDREFAYGIYHDAVQQGNWQNTFDYNAMVDNRNFNFDSYWKNKDWTAQQDQQKLENSWYETEYADRKAQQELENSWYETEYADGKVQYNQEQARDRLINIIKLGGTPDADLIASSGLTEYEVNLMIAAKQAETSKGQQGGSGDVDGDEIPKAPDPKKPDYIDDKLWAEIMSIEKGSENHQTIKEVCDELYKNKGFPAVKEALVDAKEKEIINASTYLTLFNYYRDFDNNSASVTGVGEGTYNEPKYKIANRCIDNEVYVDGEWYSYQELSEAVESGEVIEIMGANNIVYYRSYRSIFDDF